MALRDEQADILGGPILQRPESDVFAAFSQYHLAFKLVTLLGLGLLGWIACTRGLEHLKKHRELRYRKAMRRKHGIPDSDCRPFAVAYAAAKRAHLEREAQDRKKTTNDVSDHNSPAVDQRINTQKDACLRRRVPETTVQHHDYHLPGKHAAVYDIKPPEVHSLDFSDHYNPSPRRRVAISEPLPIESPPVRRTGRKEPVINLHDNEESRKRSFEDESDVEHETVKKSRIDGDELVGGDEQADWYAQYSDRSSPRVPKEFLDRQPEGTYVHMNGQSKHVDLHNEDHEHDEVMEGMDEDEVTEFKAVARGKKRDRAEAGSTFGGDDEEDIRNGRTSHHRKRRTILRRRIEIPARGQKRDREVESPESEGEGVASETSRRRAQCSPKKKKGKKAASDEISVEDPRVSKDPLCGGRRVGEGWEADGVQYKVDEKGKRLRLTLVKKARNKYHMPQDSQHPDRSAALDIYVEMWLTEEQYKQAVGKQELAWQEASRESSASRTPDVFDSPTKNGKNLLWDSVKFSPARRPFRPSIPPGTLMRLNPFEQWQSQPISGRRVASSSTIVSPILPGVADSPTRPGFRAFSKWEKQDREAEAMARIRAKIEEEKKAQAPPQKSVEISPSVTAPEVDTRPPTVPTITLTPAPTVVAEGKSDDSAAQSKTNTSTPSFVATPSTSNTVKGTATAASTTTPGFMLSAATSTTPTTASTLFPSAPTAPTTTSSTGSLSPFSLVKPPQVPSSTTPNIFGKGISESAPSSTASSPSTLGAATQPKPVPFSFAKPDISSKSPAATSSAIPKSFPSPVTFSSTPAATKPETPVPPISASGPTSGGSKPTASIFSFSGASSSSSTATTSTLSTPPVPKFSFGQPTTTSTFAPGSILVPGPASQPKPTFKFGQTPPGADDSKSGMPVSAFGTATGSNEPAKPPFGATSAFGSSTHISHSAPAMNPFGKLVTVDSDSSMSISKPPKPTLAPTSATIFDQTISSTPGAPAIGSIPVFSFCGTNSGSKSVEGSKPVVLSGGVTEGANLEAMFGGNSTEGKATFTFSASADGSKPKLPSIFGNSAEGSEPVFTFGGSAETPRATPLLGDTVEGSKLTFTFGGAAETKATSCPATESPKGPNTTDPSKPTPTSGSAAFTPFSSTSPFMHMFGKKDDAATNTSTSTSMQTKPAASFAFAAPSGASGSIFGQPSAFGTGGDSAQSVFDKPTNATSNAFGFAGTGGSSSLSAFTFGKPTAQNQKQEQ